MIDRVCFDVSTKEPLNSLKIICDSRPQDQILLVEGKEDKRVYEKVFNGQVFPVEKFSDKHRRQAIIEIMEPASKENWAKHVQGVVDKDLDISAVKVRSLEEIKVIPTDYADLEMYALCKPDFSSHLEEFTKDISSSIYKDIIDLIVKHCSPLGTIRYVSANLSPPHWFEYERFDFQKTGRKCYLSTISDREQKDIVDEVLTGVNRIPSGLELTERVSCIKDELNQYIRENELMFVNSKMFSRALKRYLRENNLYRNRYLDKDDDRIMQDARNFLKANPEIILNSELGVKITSLRNLC